MTEYAADYMSDIIPNSVDTPERKYREFVEQSLAGLAVIQDFRIVFANRALAEMTGYTVDELLAFSPEKVKSMVHPDDQELVWGRFEDRLSGKKVPRRYEFRGIRKDRANIWLEMLATATMYRGRPAIQGSIVEITERKSTERLYKSVVNTSPDSIITVSTKGVITSYNPAATRMLGYSEEELVGKHFSKLAVFRARDLPKYFTLFKQVLQGKVTKPLELSFNRKDGTELLCEIRTSLLETGGKIVGIQAISTDITDRKKREKMLKESMRKFEGLFRDNPEAIVHVDSDFRILDANPRFEDVFGYRLSEIKDKNLLDLIVPEDKLEEAQMLDAKAKEGHVYHDTVRKRKDGKLVLVSVSAAPIKIDERLIGYLGVYKDITAIKEAERKARESEAQIKTLFDLMADPVAIVDNHGKILEITKSAEAATGFRKEELVGKDFFRTSIATRKTKAIMMKNLAKRMMGMHVIPYEVEMLTNIGRRIPYEVNAAKIEYKGKSADMVIFRDISQRKKMEEKLRVVGSVTRHDIRNKLSIILGNIYLGKQLFRKDKNLECLNDAENAVQQIEKILDFARTYEKLGVEELSNIDVGKMFQEATQLVHDFGAVQLVNDCGGLLVLADSLLRQLFYNLIDNSLKHGESVNEIRLYYEETGSQLRIIYEDNGIGIPKGKKEWIFKEATGKDNGYGLYLIRKICEVYGWTITETGVPGKGARFIIAARFNR